LRPLDRVHEKAVVELDTEFEYPEIRSESGGMVFTPEVPDKRRFAGEGKAKCKSKRQTFTSFRSNVNKIACLNVANSIFLLRGFAPSAPILQLIISVRSQT
jgi:hypothetical protein